MKKMLKRLYGLLSSLCDCIYTLPTIPFMQKVSNTGRSQKSVSVSSKSNE